MAGAVTAGFSGDGMYATSALLNRPMGIAPHPAIANTFFVADSYNHRIRLITPLGVVTTLAGSGNAAFAAGALQSRASAGANDLVLAEPLQCAQRQTQLARHGGRL